MEGFQFKPGDIVTIDIEKHKSDPPRFRVLEQVARECAGGIQRHYALRSFAHKPDGAFSDSNFMMQDFEIADYPSQEQLDKRREDLEVKEAAWLERRSAARRK